MKKFRDLVEAKDTIVFAFGRFNPPTTGHEKLIKKVASVAGSNPYRIYPSFTQNPKNDPLPHSLKVAYMRKMFKKYARNIIADKDARTAIHIAVKLYDEGFKNLVMVAGSDKIKEFDMLLNTYNGVEGKRHGYYKFDSIDIINAGQRDPDSKGVEGMSATKMRAAASNGDMDSFLQGVPSGFSDGKKLYRDVRKYMGIREERDMGKMTDFEEMRNAYLTGQIWNVGDTVEANGAVGEVVRKGTNYLSFVTEDGKVHKAWLHDIELDEAKVPNDDLNWVATGGSFGKKRRFPTFVVKKEGIKYKAYDEQNKMSLKAGANSLEGLAKMLQPYIEKRTGYWRFEQNELDERNYAKEYANYHSRPEQRERNAARLRARRRMEKLGQVKKFDDLDVHHKDNDPLNNEEENLEVTTKKWNRTEPRLRGKELDEAFPIQVTVKDKKGKTHTTGTRDLRGATHALLIHYKEIPAVKGNLPGSKETKPPKTEIFLGTEKELAKQAKHMLRTHPSAKYAIGAEVVKLDQKMVKGATLGEEVKLDEEWWKTVIAKLSQMTHPKGYGKMVRDYAELMRQDKYKKHPNQAADEVARNYRGVNTREFRKYINKLVAKKVLPQELKAEYEMEEAKSPTQKLRDFDKSRTAFGKKPIFKDKGTKFVRMKKKGQMTIMNVPSNEVEKYIKKGYTREEWSFSDIVRQIQENELTDTELKRREEIAKDLSDDYFKKKYGDRWKEVKMATATKMAKKESSKT